MKTIFWLLPLLAFSHATAADTDWRKAAREFMAEQEIAPIEIQPGTRFEADLARDRLAWMQRVFLPPFEKHLEKWPAQAEAARSFVKQALMANAGHPDVDPQRPWEVMNKEGTALIKAGVDDPLVYWLTGLAAWNFNEGFTEARECISKSFRHKQLQEYPSVLILFLNDLKEETRGRDPKTPESVVKVNAERRRRIIESAVNPAVYKPEEDRLLYADAEFIFGTVNLNEASTEATEVEQFCDTPHFSPWLREMLQGRLAAGRTEDVHQVKARAHFLKAWELCPDRAAAAAAMINIVKSGNGISGETARQWFDRATAVEFDHYPAYHNYLETLRHGRHDSLDKMKAFYCACALTDRDDTAVAAAMRRTIDRLAYDSSDIRRVLSQSPMKEAAIHSCRLMAESKNVYRVWEHPWRLADLGKIAWAAGDYETADETLQQVPVPFPRETRRSRHLHLNGAENEESIRGESRLFALGLDKEWEAAEDLYRFDKVADALQSYQDLTARFQGEPPKLLLQRIAACKFERSFATAGKWLSLWAEPDLVEWNRFSGFWTGLKSGTLVINGEDAQGYIVHNGRSGTNFELMGEYEVKDGSVNQGLDIMVGYHCRGNSSHWISCMQWQDSKSIPFGGLRSIYTWPEPEITPPSGGKVWQFHIICQNGAVTFRLNHRDIVVGYHPFYQPGSLFEMPEDSTFGFSKRFFNANSRTHIRRLKIRRLEPPGGRPEEQAAPVNLAALRLGFEAACKRAIDDLNATALTEAEVLANELKRIKRDEEAAKMRAFISQLKSGRALTPDDMPVSLPGEVALDLLLRGYHASVNARMSKVRGEWKTRAQTLCKAAQNPQEAADVNLYISAHLEEAPGSPTEDPLAPANRFKWTPVAGEWTRTADMIAAGGRSGMQYDFNRRPPFQIDFDINALGSRRPQVILGNVKLAVEDAEAKTFGLYPQAGTAGVFTYQPNKLYHITLKATLEKTELLIDGAHVCDGAKIEGNVSFLRFNSGVAASSGRTEFHKIRISPLP
ncbi:hypothetical protein [Prosthecobacter sp.]|uniref:hypothetical protein n=1 Tax=Prosthecobacter sp. TaxID=1965333 RepID=UPI00378472CE